MSASNAKATSLAHSEYRSIRAFLILFIIMVTLLLGVLGYGYFQSQKELMLGELRLELQLLSEHFIPKLRERHINFDKSQEYPLTHGYESAIYDSDGTLIFSTLKASQPNLTQIISLNHGYIQFIAQPESYYLGARFVVLEKHDDGAWLEKTTQRLWVAGVPLALIFIVMGWGLTKLFLRPMRQAVELLDTFIKDTTHELNTPVTAILTNIERIDRTTLSPKNITHIDRIDIAARTIATIYDDLTFLLLNGATTTHNAPTALAPILQERLDYFHLALHQKRITLSTHLEDATLFIDAKRFRRMVDNLLSNAIKYNRVGGTIAVVLDTTMLRISDTGKGIESDKLQDIFKRYMRAEDVVGGFGLGLHIVALIAQEYHITIDINSTLGQGTSVTLQWS